MVLELQAAPWGAGAQAPALLLQLLICCEDSDERLAALQGLVGALPSGAPA